ncbi:YeiH family protein [Pseudaminobacter sp. NGMCC 1.201702]|uniref:YeiH family protein n=1 Tax=Pseudaminobacter sp. NGMCC 1.201702 TaxID=3391825 RepID=UPI0039EE30C8
MIRAGIVLACTIAGAGFSLRQLPWMTLFSPMILAVLVGMVFSNTVGVAANAKAGIAFSQKTLLRAAIVVLGFQLTAAQVLSIGVPGIAVAATALLATFVFTTLVGRWMGVDRKLTELIAAGTSICGASAIVATNAVTNARDEHVAYAIACITLFGTIAMLCYPLLMGSLGLDQHAFGLWAGASIHEVAQVVGASFQGGTQAGEIGTVVKLARIAMLAPMVLALGALAHRRTDGVDAKRPPLPWFVFAFIGVVGLNSVVTIPVEVKVLLQTLTTCLLCVGLAAMGLNTNIAEIRRHGWRPLVLAFSASLFIAAISLVLIKLEY